MSLTFNPYIQILEHNTAILDLLMAVKLSFRSLSNVLRYSIVGDNPVFLDFSPPAFLDGSRLQLPMAIMAGNRPSYLLRMLFSLRRVKGLDPSLVTVFIDGFFDEPSSVAKLFQLNVEQHAGSGKLNSRICQVTFNVMNSSASALTG